MSEADTEPTEDGDDAPAADGAAAATPAGPGSDLPPPAEVDEVEKARESAASWKARAQRAVADLSNFRKRAMKERQEAKQFAVDLLLKDLLIVVDNLERAVGVADASDPVAQGVRMVLDQFTNVVGQYGARPFEALGEAFDPNVHEAMTQIVTEEHPAGTVIEVFQRGWTLHERLARPAMVVVAAAPPRVGPEPTAERGAEPTAERGAEPTADAPDVPKSLEDAMAAAEAAVDRVKAERQAEESAAQSADTTDEEQG